MKVLFVLENTIADLQGGTEVSSWHLARLLRKKGVEVEEWSPFVSRKPIFWYTSIFGQLYILIVLAWKLVKNRVQILHVQGKYLMPSVVILGKFLKIPTVATIRDYVVICPIGLCLFSKGLSLRWQGQSLSDSRHGFWFFLTKEIPRFLSIYHDGDSLMIRIIRYVFLARGWLVTRWLRFWLKKANTVVVVSGAVKKILGQYGISSQVIHNSFDIGLLNKLSPFTIHCSRFTVLFVGKPSYGKGYDLFRSLSRNKLFKDYRFVTIGGEHKLPYRETLQKIREAAAVIVPSRWPEPFGRVAMESLMLGTPVAATQRGGLTEIIDNGMTGALVEPNLGSLSAGLKKVIEKNVELREKIYFRRRQLKEKFTRAPVEQHLGVYLKLIKG